MRILARMFETSHTCTSWLGLIAALGGIALGAGCSALIDVDGKQCQTDTDCTQKQLAATCQSNVCVPPEGTSEDAASADTTSCNGDADCSGDTPRCLRSTHVCVSEGLDQQFACEWPEPSQKSTVHYSFNVRLFVMRDKAPANLVVHACELGDIACMSPVAQFVDNTGEGAVELDLPVGVPVYFETKSEGLTVLTYVSTVPEVDLVARDVFVPTQEVLMAQTMLLNTKFEPETGLTLIEVADCTDHAAAGVHVTQNPESGVGFYLKDNLPYRNEVVTIYDSVYDRAYAGFVNVAPGSFNFSAYWGVMGPLLRSITAQVRPNAVTTVELDTRAR
jgi:hypothetical protein